MNRIYRYRFSQDASAEAIESSLVLAIMAVESLHGNAQTRLDAAHSFDAANLMCVIDASTPVGEDFSRIFTGFVLREFAEDSFEVECVGSSDRVNSAA